MASSRSSSFLHTLGHFMANGIAHCPAKHLMAPFVDKLPRVPPYRKKPKKRMTEGNKKKKEAKKEPKDEAEDGSSSETENSVVHTSEASLRRGRRKRGFRYPE